MNGFWLGFIFNILQSHTTKPKNMKAIILWNVALCSLVQICWHYEEMDFFHSSTLNMEAVRSSEKSMRSFQKTWRHTAKSYRDTSVTAFTMPSMYLHFRVILVLCIVVFKGRPMCRHYQFVGFAKYVGKTYMIAYKPKHTRSTTNHITNPGCQFADS